MAEAKKPSPAKKPLTPDKLYEKAESFVSVDSQIVDKSFREENYKTAAKFYKDAGDYLDAPEKAKECLRLAEEAREEFLSDTYAKGAEMLRNASSPEDYEHAGKVLAKVSGYRDADELLKKCDEQKGRIELRKFKRNRILAAAVIVLVVAAVAVLQAPVRRLLKGKSASEETAADEETVKELPKDMAAGDEVAFGNYTWLVLESDEEECLLAMYHAEKHEETRNGAYHDKLEDVTWADCSLRKWLNGEFLENGFAEEEREQILTETYENPGNDTYGTDGGEETEDQVTLLTPEMFTEYNEVLSAIKMNYWLRAPGASQQTAQFVSHRNKIMDYGYAVDSDQFYVVPVIRVKI